MLTMHNLEIFINKTRILAHLSRLQKKMKPMKITVIIDIYRKGQGCKMWLTKELKAQGISEAFEVKEIGECRGMEFPSVVTISGDCDFGPANLLIDTWTRVTTCLSIIHIADFESRAFIMGLEDAMNNNVAKKAEEQEMEFSDFHKSMPMIHRKQTGSSIRSKSKNVI